MEVPPRSTLSRLASQSDDRVVAPSTHAGLLQGLFWALCYFIFYFAQQIAEVLAPLCLVLGIGWLAVPHALSAITTGAVTSTDSQATDVMNHVVGSIPNHLALASHVITPSGLIIDGVLLMAFAALGATIAAFAARNM